MSEEKDMIEKVERWWNPMNAYDKNYYVKMYEGGDVPVASLSYCAIIRLYLKVFQNLTHQQALKKYHETFN